MTNRVASLLAIGTLLVTTACATIDGPGLDSCPPPREAEEICSQVIVWAKSPQSGICCRYATPCNAPEGWQTYNTAEECRAAR